MNVAGCKIFNGKCENEEYAKGVDGGTQMRRVHEAVYWGERECGGALFSWFYAPFQLAELDTCQILKIKFHIAKSLISEAQSKSPEQVMSCYDY